MNLIFEYYSVSIVSMRQIFSLHVFIHFIQFLCALSCSPIKLVQVLQIWKSPLNIWTGTTSDATEKDSVDIAFLKNPREHFHQNSERQLLKAWHSDGMEFSWYIIIVNMFQWKPFKMERIFENTVKPLGSGIKLMLFLHVVKIMCFRKLMISLSHETENSF